MTASRDRPRRYDDHLLFISAQTRYLSNNRRHDFQVKAIRAVRKKIRPELHDDPFVHDLSIGQRPRNTPIAGCRHRS